MKLSVVISTFNAQDRIEECLKSVKDIADEIIVVNNSSTDDTEKIAEQFGVRIFLRPNNPMLNANKNFGFSKANGEWILNLDDDERLTPDLAKEIKSRIKSQVSKEIDGFLIPRKNIIFGKWIQNSIWWPDYQLRLIRNGKGKFPEQHVHELIEVEGKVEKLSDPMIHNNYSTVSQYLQKMDKIYTENEAERFLAEGKKLHWTDAIRSPVDDFLKTFFLQKGYRDGLHGLVLSLLQAFYAEIVFAKIWELQGFNEENGDIFLNKVYEEFKQSGLKFKYWFLSTLIENTKNGPKKLLYKAIRKKVNSQIKK